VEGSGWRKVTLTGRHVSRLVGRVDVWFGLLSRLHEEHNY